jgi:hypothetical protein
LVVVEGPLHDIYTNYAIAGKVNSQAGYRLVCDSSNNIFMGLNSHGLAKISALNYTGSRLNIPVPSDNIDTIEHYNTGFVQLSTSSPNDSLLVGMYNSEQPSYITAGWKLRAFLFNFNNNSLITILEDGDSDKKRWPDNFS